MVPPIIHHIIDRVYNTETKTATIFEDVVKGLVSSTVQGINATVFAYGQTASGKTFTVRGNEMSPGLIPLSITEIFREIPKVKDRKFKIRVSFLELYNETIHDLLVEDSEKLEIKESMHGVFVKGLSSFEVNSLEEAMMFLKEGDTRKKMAETRLNVQSSRSHTVFRISVESKPADALPIAAARVSQFNLVDLAGSEGVSRTKAEGIRLREGVTINKSLLALSNVIHRLSTSAGKHINFRDSKLTRMLQPALGGNAKTAIICTISQQKVNYQETLNTLLFGVKAKKIKNAAKVNVIVPDTHTRYQLALKEIQRQKEELANLRDDNRQLRLMLIENAATEWDSRVSEFKHKVSPNKSHVSEDMNATIEKFTKIITDLRHINEANKQENLSLQNELSEKTASLAATENQITDLSKVIRSKDRELGRLKEILNNTGIEYSQNCEEELKGMIIAAPEEPLDQDISMVEEDDGIQLLSIAKERSRSVSRGKAHTALNESFGTPNIGGENAGFDPKFNDDLSCGYYTATPKGRYSDVYKNFAEEIKALKEQIKVYEYQLSEYETARNHNTELIQSYEKSNVSLVKDLERTKMEAEENTEAIKRLINEKVQLAIEYESSKAKCDKVSEEFLKILKANQNLEQEIENKNKEIKELSLYKDALAKNKEEVTEKQNLINTLMEESKNMKEKLDTIATERSALALKVHNLSMHKCPKIQTVKREVEEKDAMIKRLRIEQNDWFNTKTRLINELETIQKKLKDCENQLEQANGKNKTLLNRIKAVEQRNVELAEKFDKGVVCVDKHENSKRKIYTAFRVHEEGSSKRTKGEKSIAELANLSFISISRRPSLAPLSSISPNLLVDKENIGNIINSKHNQIGSVQLKIVIVVGIYLIFL
eukprot:TRINITY_DN88260_c0_g1_i1.p1 TRINITY_DN88260_c0_g1~~TRINITY_DN88260_c0_g1_i1.p1  ORF type:complete len:885 (-),score=123.96 TRINITY_DN88260_c0_g1_i1:940-3594(-)